jgi:DNA gyrase subunit A
MSMEDLIADDAVVVTISHLGYIKRTSPERIPHPGPRRHGQPRQHHARRGLPGAPLRGHQPQLPAHLHPEGPCYWMRVYDIPEGTRQSKGRAIQNLVQIEADDKVVAYLNVTDLKSEEYLNNHFVVLCTKKGIIKKTTLEAYSRPRSNGIIAVGIREGDELLEAKLTNGNSHIIMASRDGKGGPLRRRTGCAPWAVVPAGCAA